MLADLRQDLGYALRLFRRSPGFTAIAIATLALGMGATTTIFTLANWALLRPVPGVTNPANVSVIWVGTRPDHNSFSPSGLSNPNLADVAARLKTMTVGAYWGGSPLPASGGGQGARNITTQFVTASYFDVLAVPMRLGRPFTAAEDTPPSPFLGAVISDRLWQSMFSRGSDVLRQTIDVGGVRFTILGVAAPGFHGTERLSTTDVWLPGSSQPTVRHFAPRPDTRNGSGYYELVARLRPGVTWSQATLELESMRAWLRDQYPADNAKFQTVNFHLMGPIGPSPFGRTLMQKVVGPTAFGASALLMLIACANVAGLLAIKGLGRRQETAVRKALGAGRGRLLRQRVAEGVLLWIGGGAGALALLLVLRRAFDLAAVMGMGVIDMRPPIDWRVLAFTAATSLVVGVGFSIVPAYRSIRGDDAETLRAAAQGVTGRAFVATSLAVFQLGAALTLLVGAFLLAGTLRQLTAVPLGFDPGRLFVLNVRPASIGYSGPQSREYVAEFRRRLAQIPGVRSTAAATAAPFAWSTSTRVRRADAAPQARPLSAGSLEVFDRHYFEAVGIPLLAGRLFTDADFSGAQAESGPVVLSEGLARRLFGSSDPVGRDVVLPVLGREGKHQVVGVVGAARYRNLLRDPEEMLYELADTRSATREMALIVRTAASVRLADEARGIAAALNPALPVTTIRSMAESIGRARKEWDSLARLLGLLSVLAAVLASIGLYGVVAHGVAERRREFGIRAALGASRGDIWRLVLRQSTTIVGAGVAIGLIGAYVFAQVLSTRLFGVDPLDPALWSLAAAVLIAVAIAASLRPAFTATRVNLSETLRSL